MKIAIPMFASRVSPRFDCAQYILVVNIESDKDPQREEIPASDWAPHERITRLLDMRVDTVICGGIDRWSTASLQSAGVTIYGWVTGEIEDALAAFLRGELDCQTAWQGPGRCRCRRFPGDTCPPYRSMEFGSGQRGRGGRGRGGPGGGRGGGLWNGGRPKI